MRTGSLNHQIDLGEDGCQQNTGGDGHDVADQNHLDGEEHIGQDDVELLDGTGQNVHGQGHNVGRNVKYPQADFQSDDNDNQNSQRSDESHGVSLGLRLAVDNCFVFCHFTSLLYIVARMISLICSRSSL